MDRVKMLKSSVHCWCLVGRTALVPFTMTQSNAPWRFLLTNESKLETVFSHHGPWCDQTWEERFVWKTNSSALCFVALIFYLCVSCVILLLYASLKITIRQRAANSETRGFPLCIANLWALFFLHIIVPYLFSTYLYDFWRQIKVIVQFHAKILINIFFTWTFLVI